MNVTKNKRKSKRRRWIIVSSILFAAILLILATKGKNDVEEKVATEKVSRRTIIETVSATGKIYPEVEVKISSDVSGEITELNVEEGDSVKRGQILARIFSDIYALQRDEAASRVSQTIAVVENNQASLQALKANLEQARVNYYRNKKLYDDKVISGAELEQFETALKTAEANYQAALQNIRSLQANVRASQVNLSRANKDLSRTVIISPMNGVVSSLKVKKGERVAGNSFNVGTEMMTVSDMSVLEVRVEVGENDIVKINIGDSADIKVDAYDNRKFKGVVTKIGSSTKSASANNLTASNDVTNYEVRIRLLKSSYEDLAQKKFPFLPGMNANAEIKTRKAENVLSVPTASVTVRLKGSEENREDISKNKKKKTEEETDPLNAQTGDDELEEVVFVLQKDGTVKKTPVKTGIQDINYMEILSGLKEGDQVVTAPYNAISKKLKNGMKVKVVPKEKLME
ncbi:MAG: efflux RND transporter periplasmic adaptor subunit [Chitinophagaceae bacterium]|nr:efflux RND transporter periplasmic adaptor subunit [Chitinophagaceae bacterium]